MIKGQPGDAHRMIGKGVSALLRIRLSIKARGDSASFSLPRLYLTAISKPTTALNNSSLPASKKVLRALAKGRGSSVTIHSRVWVSSSTLTRPSGHRADRRNGGDHWTFGGATGTTRTIGLLARAITISSSASGTDSQGREPGLVDIDSGFGLHGAPSLAVATSSWSNKLVSL